MFNNEITIYGVDYFFTVDNAKTAKRIHSRFNEGVTQFEKHYENGKLRLTFWMPEQEVEVKKSIEMLMMNRAFAENVLKEDGYNASYDGSEFYVKPKRLVKVWSV